MRFANKILTAGVLIIVLPFLGLPSVWKNFLLFIIGVWLCFIFFSIRHGVPRGKKNSQARRAHSQAISFVENKPSEVSASPADVPPPSVNDENQQV